MTPTEKTSDKNHLCMVKKIMSLGVEDGSGVPGIVEIDIYSVVSLGSIGLVSLFVSAHGVLGDFYPLLPGIVSLGFSISVPN